MVDGLTKELQGRAQVIKIDVWSKVGRQLIGKYRVRAMPTFVVLDGAGNVQQQYAGIPDKEELLVQVESLETQD